MEEEGRRGRRGRMVDGGGRTERENGEDGRWRRKDGEGEGGG